MVQFSTLPIPKNDTRCVLAIRNHGWNAKAYPNGNGQCIVHVSSVSTIGIQKERVAESKVFQCDTIVELPLMIAKYLESKPERGVNMKGQSSVTGDVLVFRDEKGKYVVSVYKIGYTGASPWGQFRVIVTPVGVNIVLFSTLAEDVSKAKGLASTFIARGKKTE